MLKRAKNKYFVVSGIWHCGFANRIIKDKHFHIKIFYFKIDRKAKSYKFEA